jgi:nucleoside-diphosphate-sugar epimerase
MHKPKVLITGSSGTIGSVLMQHLDKDFELCGVDLCQTEANQNLYQANVANYLQILDVFQNLMPFLYLVHLAADPRVQADWQSVLMNNIVGTRNVYEAARVCGVRRIVFASTNHVTGIYEQQQVTESQMVSIHDPIKPDSDYATSKVFGEALARQYYELYGIQSICLRIGSVLDNDNPGRSNRYRKTWLSHRDLVQLVSKSLLSDQPFGIYYGVSNNKGRFWDISNAREEIDYHPLDDGSTR